MKDFIDTTVQVIVFFVGLGLGFWLLYFAFRSPGKKQDNRIEIDELDPKRKTTGQT